MKNIILGIIFGLSVFTSPLFGRNRVQTYAVNQREVIVYITRTGHKYHRASCRYLRQSKIQTTLKIAIDQGLTACSVCRP